MQSTKERVAAVKRRAAEMEKQKKLQRSRMMGAASIAASFVILVGLSLAMPGIMETITARNYSYAEMSASIFDGSAGIGYIVISLLAFVLGICVTVLCYKIRRLNREGKNEHKENDHD